jgi:steroid delta-isomerase-like uncharacterized protein
MSIEENKAIIRRWIEGMNNNDDSVIDELISDDWVYHGPTGEIKGPEGFKQMNMVTKPALPDLLYTFEDIIAEGDVVAARYTVTATHKGELFGIPATGKRITLKPAYFYRITNGKIVETIPYSDQLPLYQQLGVSPPSQ